MRSRDHRWLAVAALCAGLAGADLRAEAGGAGVVVEEIGAGSALAQAGLRAGDLLSTWERPAEPPGHPALAQGEIETVFAWAWLKAEQAPRGSLRLRGERDGAAISFDVPKGAWDARVRPRLAADLLALYGDGRRRIAAGDLEGGLAVWRQLADGGAAQAEPALRCWILLEIADAWSKGGRSGEAQTALQTAAAAAGDAQTRVAVWEALGKSYELANELARAEASFRAALETGEAVSGESLQVARTLARLGNLLRLRNRLDESAQLLDRALAIQQRWAPDGLEVADTLTQLVGLAWARDDLGAISDYAGRALAIQERWSPESLPLAKTMNALAIVAISRGRYEEAAAVLNRALAIQERRAPDSLPLATSLGNLALVARERGDVESAQELLERALAIWERLAPAGVGVPPLLTNLGAIARDRGDLTTATQLFQRALAIWSKAAPAGLGVAGSSDSLGIVARLRGDLDAAWELHSRALAIRERLAPGGDDVANTLRNLALIAEARGDFALALDFGERAEAIHLRLGAGTGEEALTLQQLGRLYHRTGRPDEAARFLARAVEALESQVGRLGGSQDTRAAFRARHEEIYHDAVEIAIERGRVAEAFHLVERSRARSFLTLLAERDLAFSGELSATIESRRRENAARYDRTLGELARWTQADGDEAREALHRELGRLRRERDQIAAEIRSASPRLAALREPQPLDLAAARQVLDAGTLALSYSVGKERTAVFALTREGDLRVEVLPLGEERLRRDVERFVELVRQPAPESPADLAQALYAALIAPIADLVERSERVLILPDGPLHRLPFGALIRDPPSAPAGRGQYLAEWKPLHTALSLTVYGTLRASAGEPARAAEPGGPARVAAFGDPRYPQSLAPQGAGREPRRPAPGFELRKFDWAALPHTRREVERLAEVYPEARLYLGEEATEERAKSVPRDVRILHFATHGHLDDRTPLDSALVLTIPEELPAGRDNGLLQVWEIFESVRLDADLVVLSACESALGRELSGEGLIGLTRAFQYAGARSVVATLWSVADQVTAELMARFHRHLAAGLPKDEALRAAQLELLREPVRITTAKGQTVETDASAPFFWAAFQLFGDWR